MMSYHAERGFVKSTLSLFRTACLVVALLYMNLPAYGAGFFNATVNGVVTGTVLDTQTKDPIQFANVILFSGKDGSQITGAMTDSSGKFKLTGIRPGSYFLRVQIIGYAVKEVSRVSVSASETQVNLGKIYLRSTAISLPDVVAEGKRSAVTFQPGKQVIDASQIKTAAGGTAVDVLQTVPSISVDINGNVSLRGSSNFQVLINGRPSIMSAQNALQQLPASSIKNIQIITNPSARYDASGTAGIINIILKKDSDLGLSGIANLMGGMNDKYGGNFMLQYRTRPISYSFGLDFNRRTFPGTNNQEKQFIIGSNTSYLNSNGSELWQRILSGVRGGLDFNLGRNDNLSISGRYGARTFHHYSSLNTDQSSTSQSTQLNYLDNHNYNNYGDFYGVNLNYTHDFSRNGHKLSAFLTYRRHNSNQAALSTASQSLNLLNGTQTTELGPHSELRGNVDYTLPIDKAEKFSAGSEFFVRNYNDVNKLYTYDSTSGLYAFQAPFSHTNNFKRGRFAAYSIFNDKWDSLGVQAGLRTEYTYQFVGQADSSTNYTFSRWDFFPSLSASYSLSDGLQVMASYTRRIQRPDGGDLEPYYSWFDANTVHIGNPSLKPELIDSYEIGLQTFIGSATLSSDIYYRLTHDKIEHINSVYAENVTLTSVANVGNDYALGYEFSLQVSPVKMWDMNLMGDLYDYRISGAISSQSFARQSLDWSAKDNNTFTLTQSTEVQLNVRYHSPSVTAQGTWGGFFTTDLALKQDLIAKTLSLTFQANDILNTGRREFTSQGTDFYEHVYYYRRAPVLMLNLQYTFNNYKAPKSFKDGEDN